MKTKKFTEEEITKVFLEILLTAESSSLSERFSLAHLVLTARAELAMAERELAECRAELVKERGLALMAENRVIMRTAERDAAKLEVRRLRDSLALGFIQMSRKGGA